MYKYIAREAMAWETCRTMSKLLGYDSQELVPSLELSSNWYKGICVAKCIRFYYTELTLYTDVLGR